MKPTPIETPARRAAEGAFTRGSQGWALLTQPQRDSWTKAARGVKSKDPKRIRPVSISGSNMYLGYSAKYLQLHPGTTAPGSAPTARFAGDDLVLGLESREGKLTVTSDRANRAGVTSEILVQSMVAAHRKPTKKYDHAAFTVFAAGSLSVAVPLPSGAYSVAVQYVETATGAVTGFQVLGTTTVLSLVEGGLSDEGEGLRAA